MTVDARVHTAEDLLGFPGWPRYELVEGELREMSPSGADHSAIALRIGASMLAHVEQHRLGGRVYGADAGFLLSRDPDTVVAPDAAYVASARVVPSPKFFPRAPDVPGDSRCTCIARRARRTCPVH